MTSADELYDSAYYESHMTTGDTIPYERSQHWLDFFGGVADHIVHRLHPITVLDAGCAHGFLVEALRDRAVDASGFDASSFAISQAHVSIADRVRVASITDPIDGRFDLVTCIEVVEHLPASDAPKALANLASVTSQILLSTTPHDFKEPTHLNVQPPDYWAGLLSDLGFHRDPDVDCSFLTPWAGLFRRDDSDTRAIVTRAERERWNLVRERDALREELLRVAQGSDGSQEAEIRQLRDDLRLARDAAHAADARRSSVESRMRFLDYALDISQHREAEMEELIERLYEVGGGDAMKINAMVNARTFDVYWTLLKPYRWLRKMR